MAHIWPHPTAKKKIYVYRESVSMCEICGGVFFFFYCPLLPLWWSLGFLLQHTKKAWRRYRRRKQFQAQQAEKRAGEEKAYLALDKYVKGGVKEFVDFNATLKRGAKEKAESAAEGIDNHSGFGSVADETLCRIGFRSCCK